jgi:hypothetical protein
MTDEKEVDIELEGREDEDVNDPSCRYIKNNQCPFANDML